MIVMRFAVKLRPILTFVSLACLIPGAAAALEISFPVADGSVHVEPFIHDPLPVVSGGASVVGLTSLTAEVDFGFAFLSSTSDEGDPIVFGLDGLGATLNLTGSLPLLPGLDAEIPFDFGTLTLDEGLLDGYNEGRQELFGRDFATDPLQLALSEPVVISSTAGGVQTLTVPLDLQPVQVDGIGTFSLAGELVFRTVPEPAAGALVAVGIALLAAMRRRG